jgi:hypothetical protein
MLVAKTGDDVRLELRSRFPLTRTSQALDAVSTTGFRHGARTP